MNNRYDVLATRRISHPKPIKLEKKMKTLTLALSAVLLFAVFSHAQTPAKSDDKSPSKTYEALLSKLKDGDTTIDYKALRMSYTETKDYSSYGTDPELRSKLFKANADKKYSDAISIADIILKTNYVDINAHFVAYIAHRESGDAKKSKFHKAVFDGLVNSILNGADGKSAKTAFTVICVPEEYVVINFLGYKRGSQALVVEDGHRFDILTVTDDANTTHKLYFNIDIVWKGYEKMFSK
jgi:hypothetical protein